MIKNRPIRVGSKSRVEFTVIESIWKELKSKTLLVKDSKSVT